MVDAMALMGEFLKAVEKNAGARGVGVSGVPPENPTLAECGITKKESMNAQSLVDVREKMPEVFEAVRAGRVIRRLRPGRMRP